jgi:hypothetical protein
MWFVELNGRGTIASLTAIAWRESRSTARSEFDPERRRFADQHRRRWIGTSGSQSRQARA